jgi:hypothetical protein
MTTAKACLAVACTIVLAGCGTHPVHHGAAVPDARASRVAVAKCTPGNCKVPITVIETADGCAGSIALDVIDVRMGGIDRTGQKVEFTLPGGSGYRFAGDSAQPGWKPAFWIKSGPDPFVGAPRVKANGKVLEGELKPRGSGGIIEYGVRFARDQTSISYCADIDPWMVD